MIISGIIFFLLYIHQVHEVLGSDVEPKFPEDCGGTPMLPKGQIINGFIVQPEEFSWLASLQYGQRNTFGFCGGSVINSLYVLTAAHCVTGKNVQKHGGLTGVRLGDFTQRPFCDYGSPLCSAYLDFGISNIKVHEKFVKDIHGIIRNDIALIRLGRKIIFNEFLKPVCLPKIDMKEPDNSTTLTVSGWGKSYEENEELAKRAVDVPLLTDSKVCEYEDEGIFCAAVLSSNRDEVRTTCAGDSGGPLMQQWQKRRMVIEGIVSYGQSNCYSMFFPTHYTRVRNYLNWIEENVNMDDERSSPTRTLDVDPKFPTDCGLTPKYYTDDDTIQPDEYSWVADLVFINRKILTICTGSVINSRYVLTTAYCVIEVPKAFGDIAAVRLQKYDENGHRCSDDSENCARYQDFGIEEITVHREYQDIRHYDIALIRLNTRIQFSEEMQPICLPFGENRISKPSESVRLISYGQSVISDRAKKVFVRERCKGGRTTICLKSHFYLRKSRNLGPLMYAFQFNLKYDRMVLEGLSSDDNLIGRDLIFTNVREFGDWLDNNMKM